MDLHGQQVYEVGEHGVRAGIGIAQLKGTGDAQIRHRRIAVQPAGAVARQLGHKVGQTHVVCGQQAARPLGGAGVRRLGTAHAHGVKPQLLACLQLLRGAATGGDLHGTLQHGHLAALPDTAHDKARAYGAHPALPGGDHEGPGWGLRVGRGFDEDGALVQMDAAQLIVKPHIHGTGRIEHQTAAIGQRPFAALARGRGVGGGPLHPGRGAPGQPAHGGRRDQQGQRTHGIAAAHGAQTALLAAQGRCPQCGRQAARTLAHGQGAQPGLLMDIGTGAPGLEGAVVGLAGLARVQQHEPFGGLQGDFARQRRCSLGVHGVHADSRMHSAMAWAM